MVLTYQTNRVGDCFTNVCNERNSGTAEADSLGALPDAPYIHTMGK